MDIPTWTVIATGGAVFGWFALFFVAERLAPAVQPMVPTGLPRLACNAAFWLLNTLLSPLAVLPLTAWAAAHSLNVRPEWWAGLPALAFDVLLLDLLIYWWHRANHEWRLLWRFHEVHHLDRFLDSTTAIRFHFGEVLLSAGARAAVILLLGFPFVSIVLFESLLLCATIFHHSNLRIPAGIERALSLVIIVPGIHWVHHHAVRADTDSNYGTLFSFWDRIFRTRSPTRRTPTMAIGVEGEDDRALAALLARPFRRRR